MMIIRLVLALTAIGALLILPACGGDAEEEGPSTQPAATTGAAAPTAAPTAAPAEADPTAVPTPTAAAIAGAGTGELAWANPTDESLAKFSGARQGGTLIIGLKSPIGPLDPDINLTGNAHQVLINAYEALLERDWEYATTDNYEDKFPPRKFGLAQAVRWEGDTIVFDLQEGVTFHDGTPFNAEAAEFSYRRIFDEQFEHYSDQAGAVAADIGQLVVDYEVRDEHTLAVTLTARNWDFPDWQSGYGRYAMMSPAAVMEFGNEAMASTYMVGTGPFKLVSHEPNVRTVLEVYEDYWRGRANLDSLIFIPIPDEGARVAALLQGEVDVIYEVGPDYVDDIRARDDLTMYTRGKPSVWELQPNYKFSDSPLLDPNVRKALSLAIDRQGMADILMKGTMYPAQMFSSPNAATYQAQIPVDAYDPETAKELLADAGYEDGFSLRVKVPGAGCGIPGTVLMTEMVQSQWAEIGVTLNITAMDWVQYVGEWIQGADDPVNTDFELLSMCSGLDSPYRIAMDMASYTWAPGGWNVGHFQDPEIDRLLQAGATAETYEEYLDYTKQAEAKAVELTQNFWLVHDGNPIAASNKIKGWKPAKEWVDRFTYAWIEE